MLYILNKDFLSKYQSLKEANFFLTPEDSFNGEFWGEEDEDWIEENQEY